MPEDPADPDYVAVRDMVRQIEQSAAEVPGVDCVEKALVRKMGHQFYVDMHVQVNPQMTVLRSHEIAHDVKDRIRSELSEVRDVLVHIEPAKGDNPGNV